MTKIASMTLPIPRGTVIRKRVGVQPIAEAEDFFKCEACGGWIDMRDLGRDPRSRRALAASGVRSSAVSQLQPRRRVSVLPSTRFRLRRPPSLSAPLGRAGRSALRDAASVVKRHVTQMKEAAN